MNTSASSAARASTAIVLLLVALLAGGGQPAAQARPAGPGTEPSTPVVLRVYFRDMAERDSLARELDTLELPTTAGYLTVLASDETYRHLQAQGLRVEVDPTPSLRMSAGATGSGPPPGFARAQQAQQGQQGQQAQQAQQAPNTFFDGYLTVEGIQAFLDSKVAQHPDLAEKVNIGASWCKTHPGLCTLPDNWNGYDLWVLHITNRAIPGPKPVYWYDAGIHSREIATPELAMRFIDHLLDGYSSDADAHWLVDWHDIWVMPLVNPDGHHIVEAGGGGEDPYPQRKNADRDDGCSTWPPRTQIQFGTDLNRNFPFAWNCCQGSSGAPCTEEFRGPSQGSEEETQAVVSKVRQLIPDQRGPNSSDAVPITATGVYQNMHSFANLNLYPWGTTADPAPNEPDLKNIAAHMSAKDAGGNGYDYCQPAACLYTTDGTANDWAYGELGAAGFTTELSGGTFFPPYSQVQSIYSENQGMLVYLAKIARTPYLLTRGPDATSVAVAEEQVAPGTPAHLTATINYAWTGNAYTQDVAAAEYYVDTPPWAGGTPLPMAPSDGALDSLTEEVGASIDTSAMAPGKHIVFVRGRGANSYDGYQSWGPPTATWLVVGEPGPLPAADQGQAGASPNGGRPGR